MSFSDFKLEKIACIGCGVIGAGWAARFIQNGIDVNIFDTDPSVSHRLTSTISNAEIALANLTTVPRLARGLIEYKSNIRDAVFDVDLIIESVPERLNIKHQVYKEIEAFSKKSCLIASSTSGIMPSDLQSQMSFPERFYVAHPFNPVYLLPLVEIVGGEKTSQSTIKKALNIYSQLGMHPIHIKKEIEAFVADRLLEAIWRESLWLIKDGICTTGELDDIVRFGFGLRYAQMGVFDTYRVAGGDAGMRHFMAQFGPCLKWPWTKLMDVPEFTPELVELIASQSDIQSGHLTINELEKTRDKNLVAIQRALRENNWGAGVILEKYEKKLNKIANKKRQKELNFVKPIETVATTVPQSWTDYNGHMNEARYLDCFCNATDEFMKFIGCDEKYIKNGGSYFTVETHIRHLTEANAGDSLTVQTQLMDGNAKKLHLFHTMRNSKNRITATGEHLLIHVSLKTRSSSEPCKSISNKIKTTFKYHRKLPLPEGSGYSIESSRNRRKNSKEK